MKCMQMKARSQQVQPHARRWSRWKIFFAGCTKILSTSQPVWSRLLNRSPLVFLISLLTGTLIDFRWQQSKQQKVSGFHINTVEGYRFVYPPHHGFSCCSLQSSVCERHPAVFPLLLSHCCCCSFITNSSVCIVFWVFFLPPLRLLGGAGGADRSRESQGESDRAGGQHLLHPAGGAGEDPPGGAAGVWEESRQVMVQLVEIFYFVLIILKLYIFVNVCCPQSSTGWDSTVHWFPKSEQWSGQRLCPHTGTGCWYVNIYILCLNMS